MHYLKKLLSKGDEGNCQWPDPDNTLAGMYPKIHVNLFTTCNMTSSILLYKNLRLLTNIFLEKSIFLTCFVLRLIFHLFLCWYVSWVNQESATCFLSYTTLNICVESQQRPASKYGTEQNYQSSRLNYSQTKGFMIGIESYIFFEREKSGFFLKMYIVI